MDTIEDLQVEPKSAGPHVAAALRKQARNAREAAERVVASGSRLNSRSRGASPRARADARRAAKPSESAREKPGSASAEQQSAVHDLRVALRRLRSMLRPARALFGEKRVRRLEARLKSYADATGALRDEEVLAQTLADLELEPDPRASLRTWCSRRARTERELRSAVVSRLRREAEIDAGRSLNGGSARPNGSSLPGSRANRSGSEDASSAGRDVRLSELVAELEALLARSPGKKRRELFDGTLAKFAFRSITEALEGMRALGVLEATDVAGLHKLRIRYKRLRYVAEAFGGPLGDDARVIAKAAEKLQKRLGHVHDLDVAIVRMRRAWGLPSEMRSAVVRALEDARERSARRALRDHADEGAYIDAAFEALRELVLAMDARGSGLAPNGAAADLLRSKGGRGERRARSAKVRSTEPPDP